MLTKYQYAGIAFGIISATIYFTRDYQVPTSPFRPTIINITNEFGETLVLQKKALNAEPDDSYSLMLALLSEAIDGTMKPSQSELSSCRQATAEANKEHDLLRKRDEVRIWLQSLSNQPTPAPRSTPSAPPSAPPPYEPWIQELRALDVQSSMTGNLDEQSSMTGNIVPPGNLSLEQDYAEDARLSRIRASEYLSRCKMDYRDAILKWERFRGSIDGLRNTLAYILDDSNGALRLEKDIMSQSSATALESMLSNNEFQKRLRQKSSSLFKSYSYSIILSDVNGHKNVIDMNLFCLGPDARRVYSPTSLVEVFSEKLKVPAKSFYRTKGESDSLLDNTDLMRFIHLSVCKYKGAEFLVNHSYPTLQRPPV
jgi:hypothetical protein